MWGAITDRSSAAPSLSALAAGAVLVALALPTLQLHTTQTGMEGITTPVVEPFKHLMKAFPGTPRSGRGRHQGRRRQRRSGAEGDRRAQAEGTRQRRDARPIKVEINRDGTVARVDIPLDGNGVDGRSTAALETLRTTCCRRPSARSTASSTP